MRCPGCGGHNADEAPWCTQCYRPLRGRDGIHDLVVTDEPTDEDTDEPTRHPELGERPAAETTSARDVRVVDGEVEWRCPACAAWSPLASPTCLRCASPRAGFGTATDVAGPPPSGLVVASLLLPGLGHVLAGRSGSGLARGVLAVLWLLGGLVLVVGGQGAARAPGWVLLAGAAILWAATAVDASLLQRGERRQLLGSRALGLLVVLVTGALVAAGALLPISGR